MYHVYLFSLFNFAQLCHHLPLPTVTIAFIYPSYHNFQNKERPLVCQINIEHDYKLVTLTEKKLTFESDCLISLTDSALSHSSEKSLCWMPFSWAHFSSTGREGTTKATQ